MAQKIYKPYVKTEKSSGIQSFKGAKSKTDTAGYMSLERRVKSLQHAGQILQQSRIHQFDGTGEDYVAPPHRGLHADLADLSELARENADRLSHIKRKSDKNKKDQKQLELALEEANEKTDPETEPEAPKTKAKTAEKIKPDE